MKMAKSSRSVFVLQAARLVVIMIVCGSSFPTHAQTLTELPPTPTVGGLWGADIVLHAPNHLTVSYNTQEGEDYAGALIQYVGAPADFSSLTQFVFGVKGDPNTITLEIKDNASGNSGYIHSPVLTDEMQFWIIDVDDIGGVNLASVDEFIFVVHGSSHGGNPVGTFDIYVEGLPYEGPPPVPVSPAGSFDPPITVLLGWPVVNSLDDTEFEQHSTTNFTVSYELPEADSWRGVMVRWDYLSSCDLSVFTQFVFGVEGDPAAIKVKFENPDGAWRIFNLNGVSNTLQHWHIDASLIDFLDNVAGISFIVDRGLAGAGNEDGEYTVYVGGLFHDAPLPVITPSDPGLAPITILPDGPRISDVDGTDFEQHSSSNFTVNYTLPGGDDWDGVMVHREAFAPMDLIFIETFVLGLTGTPHSVRIDFKDSSFKTTVFILDGITTAMQHWHIDAALIENLDEIVEITFVVDQGLAGAGNEEGHFTVFLGGLWFDDNEYTDGISNWWWARYEVPVPERVAVNHPVGHLFPYMHIYVTDTDPRETGEGQYYPGLIETMTRANGEITLWTGEPTSTNRHYDVWYSDDLKAEPQDWRPMGLNVSGAPNRAAVPLTINADRDMRFYRTGVKVPSRSQNGNR